MPQKMINLTIALPASHEKKVNSMDKISAAILSNRICEDLFQYVPPPPLSHLFHAQVLISTSTFLCRSLTYNANLEFLL
jgi:hypothetical protein